MRAIESFLGAGYESKKDCHRMKRRRKHDPRGG
jgi:hypothetical protein